MHILVTGATGSIGRQLVPQLLDAGHQVRALVRDPARAAAVLPPAVELVAGDVLVPQTLGPACAGIDVAYYLVHSMEGDAFSFEERDRRAARTFGEAARAAGLKRIVYLGWAIRRRASVSTCAAARRSGRCSPRPASR